MNLNFFFKPKSIAVIGASNNPLKLGYEVFKNLRKYQGKIYPVNVREKVVQGVKAYKNIININDDIDLAIIVIPKQFVEKALIECGEAGVKGVVIITGGFGETGGEGKEEEEKLLEIAGKYGVRIIGPNCVGIMDTWSRLNATFIMNARKGSIAFISQSGALAAGIIYKTLREKIGFSKFISVGNMVDIGFSELLEYLSEDPETKAITLYMEGLKKGREFLYAATEASTKKPIIVLKAGKSSAGARAIVSHTGSLAGSHTIYKAAFKQAGVIVAENIDEMLSMARVFTQPLPKKCSVAVMTNAGGPGVLVSDEIDSRGVKLAELSSTTISELKSFLPSIASIKNPVDMVASARGKDYYRALKTLLQDINVGLVVAVCVVPTFAGMTRTEHAEGIISVLEEHYEKPVITLFMAGDVSEDANKMLGEKGIPVYERPEDAAAAVKALCIYKEYLEKRLKNEAGCRFR